MAETKPFASLSSGLLARKGGAKPAMRPQGLGSFGGSLEDLGWNDMGHVPTPMPEHVPSPIDALTPAGPSRPAEPPVVVEQQRSLEETFAPSAEVVTLPRSPAPRAKAKAAFTLRLDPDRHLKLRLACALHRRSAQQLVTQALDEFLVSLPGLEALADTAEAGKRKTGVGI